MKTQTLTSTLLSLVALLSFLHQSSITTAAAITAPVVEIPHLGKVQGLVQPIPEHNPVNLFMGIRYGRADRFAAPLPAQPWSPATYDASRPRFACPQENYRLTDQLPPVTTTTTNSSSPLTTTEHVANEDCLYLNVWQPTGTGGNRTVMVWIYGGAFVQGTIFTSAYDCGYIAAAGDTVVVSIAYRLGALGFVYGGEGQDGEPTAPGNLGLRDQILALEWVRDNIAAFGGNPADVTIFGQSAGSMSVGALILSPFAEGLFRRAILQSGSPNAYLGAEAKEKARSKLVDLAGRVDTCSKSNSQSPKALIACLRNASTAQIMAADRNSIQDGVSFLPITGDAVLPVTSVVAGLKQGRFNHNVDVLFGVTSGEGSGFFTTDRFPLLAVPDSQLTLTAVRSMIDLIFQVFHVNAHREVADFYTAGLNNDTEKDVLRQTVSDATGDYHLVCPTVLFGQALAQYNPIRAARKYYAYRLTHAPGGGCHGWQGVCHGEDYVFTFGRPLVAPTVATTDADRTLARDIVGAWTRFARIGSPGTLGSVTWAPAFALDNGHAPTVSVMQLDPADYRMVPDHFRRVCDGFWKERIFV